MSVHVSSAVWHATFYAGSDLLVLLALADWANDEGESWHSVSMLADRVRLSVRQTQKVIGHLKGLGAIDVDLQLAPRMVAGRDGRTRRTNLFRVLIGQPDIIAQLASPSSPRHEGQGVASDADGVSPATERGVTGDATTLFRSNTSVNTLVAHPRRRIETGEDIAALVDEFADRLGGRRAVQDQIEDARNHVAYGKRVDKVAYLRTWLRREVEWRAKHNGQVRVNGRRNGHVPPEAGIDWNRAFEHPAFKRDTDA